MKSPKTCPKFDPKRGIWNAERRTQEPSSGHHSLKVVGQAHGAHGDAPERHNNGNEDAGSQPLEQNVRQGLKEGVGDEEDGQAGIVLAAGDMETLL